MPSTIPAMTGAAHSQGERGGSSYAVPLGKIHTDDTQTGQDFIVLDELSDGLLSHDMADMVDRLDHSAIDRVVRHVLHETAVDL